MCLVPASIDRVQRCSEEFSSDQICVAWMKPDGGDAIDEYFLIWSSDLSPQSTASVIHVPSITVYNYTINALPGETININVRARNSGGDGSMSTATFTTSTVKLRCISKN